MTDYTPDPQTFRSILDVPKHRDACPPGLDAHTYAAAQTFDIAYDEVTPQQRALAKELSFGAPSTVDYAKLESQTLVQLVSVYGGLVVHDSFNASTRPNTMLLGVALHRRLAEIFGLTRRRRPRRIDKKFARRGWQQHYARRR